MTSLRLTKRSLSNLLRRSLRGIWSGGGETSKVSRPPSSSTSPTSEGPGFHQEKTPAREDNPSNSGAKGAMATTLVANDTPPVSAAPEPLTSPPGEDQTCSMEVDDGDDHQPPASPVSHREDELLTGNNAVGVKGEMANITVSSPRGHDGGDEGASA